MATFKVILDKRTKKKNGQYNLTVRVVHGSDVLYLNISKLTEQQYNQIFIKKSMDKKSIEFREKCNGYVSKCERIYAGMITYNRERFKELFYEEDKKLPTSLIVSDLFDYYIDKQCEFLKPATLDHIRKSKNLLNTYYKGITVAEITVDFLKRLENKILDKGLSRETVNSHFRNIRALLNYFIYKVKLIPNSYEYPFGRGGYSIRSFFKKKIVLRNDEIERIVSYADFDTSSQQYARDIWLLLYRCNGINFVDLLRLRWDNIHGDYIFFIRKKTETTRKNNIKEITIPVTPRLRELIDKIGDKSSPFILGKLKEGYLETTFNNRKHKITQAINRELKTLKDKLNLSVDLNLNSARRTYATTLLRAGKSKDEISEMLGHSNSVVTEHYLAAIEVEKTFKINEVLF